MADLIRTRCLLFSLIFRALNDISCRICIIHSNAGVKLLMYFFHYIPSWKDMVAYVQHKAYFLIQLNADSLYPFACWFLCLLCMLILMLIILMLILIESRSMLIVYWLGDRKLINAYLTTTAYKILTSQKSFWKFKFMYCKIFINVLECR